MEQDTSIRGGISVGKRGWFKLIGYEPHQFQWEFHNSPARFKSLFGGSGVGKSISAAREATPYALVPGKNIWIVGSTYELASREFQYIWDDFEKVGLLKLATYKSNDPRHGRMFVEFPWKAGIWAKSAENPESLLGLGVHCLVLAEGSQLKQDIFERYLLRAVNRVKGCIINNTTPKGYNWEYETFYVPGQQYLDGVPNSRYRPTHWSSIVDVLQNPEYSKEDYEYARGILPKETFEEQYLGRFTHYSGLVYKDFINKPGIVGSHVVLPYKLDPTWTRILGYDAGANHATAILFGAIKPPRTLVIYDEIHTKGLGISEYAKLIQTKLSAGGVDIKPYAIYLDPSAKQLGIDMALLDIPCTPAENAILPGVERIRNALRLHELEIFNYCEKTIWEVERYVWDRETNKPLKFEDDAMDALRYMFSHPFPKYTTKQDIRNMEHLSQSDRWAWEKALKRREPRKVAPFNAFISEPTYEEEKYAGDKEEFFYPFSA